MVMEFYFVMAARLLIACILGGIIGYERENVHRPAGFRTHILVCVGAALVMVTSEFIFRQYKNIAAIDPTRLGAQVISGIGFLGAGTIIREGFNVKGLTTAASLWAVSCVGIAAGAGYYEGAIATTVIIYFTLIFLKKLELHFSKKNRLKTLYIESDNTVGQISTIISLFESKKIAIRNVQFISSEQEKNICVKIVAKFPDIHEEPGKVLEQQESDMIRELHGIPGIRKVYEE